MSSKGERCEDSRELCSNCRQYSTQTTEQEHRPAQVRVWEQSENPSGAKGRSQNITELQDPSKGDPAPKGAAGKPRLGGHLLVTSPGKLLLSRPYLLIWMDIIEKKNERSMSDPGRLDEWMQKMPSGQGLGLHRIFTASLTANVRLKDY